MKRRLIWPGVIVLVTLSVAGCASLDRIYRALYGGLQIREEIVNPDAQRGPIKDRPLTYEEYQAERERAERQQKEPR